MTADSITTSKVITLFLVLLAIIILVVGFAKIFWPGVKTALGWDVGGDLTSSKGGIIEMYTSFLNDYKSCKESSDNNCFCQINHFSLPNGFFIQLDNQGSESSIRLFMGNEILNKEDEEKEKNIIKDDLLMFPTKTPGQIGSFINSKGDFDFRNYEVANNILLLSSNKGSSSTGIAMSGFKEGVKINEFSLYGLYKTYGGINTYFVPSPSQLIGTGCEKCLMNSLKENLRQCSRIDAESKSKLDETLIEFKSKVDQCNSIHSSQNQRCNDKFLIKIPDDYKIIFSDKQANIIRLTAPNTQPESYPIELQSGMATVPNLKYIFVNGKWRWKSNTPSWCSCIYYSVDILELQDWYKKINAQLVEANTYEDSYEAGLAVLIDSLKDESGWFSSPALKVFNKNIGLTYGSSDFGLDMEENINEIKEHATKEKAQTDNILMKFDLGVKICNLKSIDSVQIDNSEFSLSGNNWLELVSMADGSICYYKYTKTEIEDLARKNQLNKIFN
jgi:hypothetical protein